MTPPPRAYASSTADIRTIDGYGEVKRTQNGSQDKDMPSSNRTM